MEITLKWNNEIFLSHSSLKSLLNELGDLLPNPLSQRVDVGSYATKLLAYADIVYAMHGDNVVGLLAIYANNLDSKHSHITILSILEEYQGRGVGKKMVMMALGLALSRGMKTVGLNVVRGNVTAESMYSKLGFYLTKEDGDNMEMQCNLNNIEAYNAS